MNSYNKIKVLKTSYTNIFSTFLIAGEEGIEPPLTVLETAALPLYYSPIVSAPDHRCITNEMNYTTGHSCLASKILFFCIQSEEKWQIEHCAIILSMLCKRKGVHIVGAIMQIRWNITKKCVRTQKQGTEIWRLKGMYILNKIQGAKVLSGLNCPNCFQGSGTKLC